MSYSPYQPPEVIECVDIADRRGGHIYYVRDDEDAQFWCRVEFMHRRLVCWCDDGLARQDDQGEPECRHLVAVLHWRALGNQPSTLAGSSVNPSVFVD